jgi:hypothetical protein
MIVHKYTRMQIFILSLFCYSIPQVFAITIDADHPFFQYSGRIDFSDAKHPVLFWPGTSIRTIFEGSSLSILLDDQNGQSYYNVFVDEDFENPHIITCEKGVQRYSISSELADTAHDLLIFRRTEASTGPTKFSGIELGENKTLLKPPDRPKRKLLFYGNSITCGMGNEAADNADDDNMAEENNYLAYGAIAARKLDAEYVCIAKSGIGILISWFDMVMPEYYYRLDPEDPNSRWDFSRYRPDVVIINLFQNDSWLIGNLNPVPDATAIIDAYLKFIREIRDHHPGAFIVCSLGNMDATKPGSPWPGYIEKAVERLKNENGDIDIDTYFFEFKNWWKHPRVRHHQEMGEGLADFIGGKMEWTMDPTSIGPEVGMRSPEKLHIYQNYPNPFNPSTQIEYSIRDTHHVRLTVCDILGKELAVLQDGIQRSGEYRVHFDADGFSSGVYFCKLETNSRILTQKMLLVR